MAAIIFTIKMKKKLSFDEVSGLVKVTGKVGKRSLSRRLRYSDTWFPVGDTVLKSYGGWLMVERQGLSASCSRHHACLLSCLPAMKESSPSGTLGPDKLFLLLVAFVHSALSQQ